MSAITDFLPLWGKWYLSGTPVKKKEADSAFLGEGSFGAVWRVYSEDESGRDYAAVKHISVPQNEEEIENLRAERIITTEESAKTYYEHELQGLRAEIAAMRKLRGYTNIVSYEDDQVFMKKGGIGYDLFLRMELLKPLNNFEAGIGQEEIVKLGIDIATAIEVMNKHGLVHRDIKPQNIFVNSTGDYKLGDFGTVRSVKSDATAMSVKGTYNYMAPEIVKQSDADNTVDIYSLGIVLYKLLNHNRVPFLPIDEGTAITPDMINDAQVKRFSGKYEIPSPIDADPELSRIVLKCCEYDSARRWKSGEELRKALINYQIRFEKENKNHEESEDPTVKEVRGDILRNQKLEINVEIEAADQTLKGKQESKSEQETNQNNGSREKRASHISPRILTVVLSLVVIIIVATMIMYRNRDKPSIPIGTSVNTFSEAAESDEDLHYDTGLKRAHYYTGLKRAISFRMPDGWIQREPIGEYEQLEVKFLTPDKTETQIIYACKDIVEENGYSENMRQYFSSAAFSEEEIKKMFEQLSELTVERRKIAGIECFIVKGKEVLPSTWILIVEDGYMHAFVLYEAEDSNLQKDLDVLYKIVESVRFPVQLEILTGR